MDIEDAKSEFIKKASVIIEKLSEIEVLKSELNEIINTLKPVEGKWTSWVGGSCPVDAETYVSVILRDGTEITRVKARALAWGSCYCLGNVQAYMLHEEES